MGVLVTAKQRQQSTKLTRIRERGQRREKREREREKKETERGYAKRVSDVTRREGRRQQSAVAVLLVAFHH
jgi:hypothetical protein